MDNRNNKGPKIDPCGTPHFIFLGLDNWPFTRHCCSLLDRQDACSGVHTGLIMRGCVLACKGTNTQVIYDAILTDTSSWVFDNTAKNIQLFLIYYKHSTMLGLKIKRKLHQYIVNKPKAPKSQTFKDFKTSVDRL
jgi:hypothetical protein